MLSTSHHLLYTNTSDILFQNFQIIHHHVLSSSVIPAVSLAVYTTSAVYAYDVVPQIIR